MRSQYSYPARIERDEGGRYQVRFADLPDALTDGADPAEALTEAADCLSAAIASRIIDGEEIPTPSPPAAGQRLVSPDPTIALKTALYAALGRRDMTVADLADRLGMGDWHQAARLIDPKRATKLTTLMAALDALRCEVEIAVNDVFVPDDGSSAVPPAGGGAVLHGGSFRAPGPTGGSPAAGRGTRSPLPPLLPVATPGARTQSPPARSRRKAKARSPD
jgi:predicted RNase H-like HicB family nuclease